MEWTKPPHYVNGVLTLRLPHEDQPPSDAEFDKRLHEYLRLTKKQSGR